MSDDRIEKLKALVEKQAEDEGLWAIAVYASEHYIQHALRELHEAVELAHPPETLEILEQESANWCSCADVENCEQAGHGVPGIICRAIFGGV